MNAMQTSHNCLKVIEVNTTSNDETSSNGGGTSKVKVGGMFVDPVTVTHVVYVISHTWT